MIIDKAVPKRFRPLYLALTIPAAIYCLAGLYATFAYDDRPAWANFIVPVAMATVGAQALMRPDSHFPRIKSRTVATIFFSLAAITLILTLTDF